LTTPAEPPSPGSPPPSPPKKRKKMEPENQDKPLDPSKLKFFLERKKRIGESLLRNLFQTTIAQLRNHTRRVNQGRHRPMFHSWGPKRKSQYNR
jgi:hypothetical protein